MAIVIVHTFDDLFHFVSFRFVPFRFVPFRVLSLAVHTLDFRLAVQKLRREFTHVQNFLFKIAAQSARMREFSSQFLDNQPEIIAEIECNAIDSIDYVTGIGNAHAHNGVHSVLRLG